MSKQLQVNTREERRLWNEMRNELRTHNSFQVRQRYYPFMLELWEQRRILIENSYREKIQEENKKNKILNVERENMRREEFIQRELEKKNLREKRAEYRKELKEQRQKEITENPNVIRRSQRLQKTQEI
jgi:hypothetical protein